MIKHNVREEYQAPCCSEPCSNKFPLLANILMITLPLMVTESSPWLPNWEEIEKMKQMTPEVSKNQPACQSLKIAVMWSVMS